MKIITPEPITSQQHQILLLLYRFRFLNRTHIQRFLHHKSDSRISTWLKDLTDRKIICRIYAKTQTSLYSPAVYYLDNKSRHILKTDERCQPLVLNRVYKEKQVQSFFRNHWQFMADVYFCFEQKAESEGAKLSFHTTTDLVTIQYLPLPLPDAYVELKGGDQTNRFFVELIDGKTRWFAVDERIRQYISYFKGKYWQSHVDYPFPRILLICPNTALKVRIRTTLKKELDDRYTELQFFLGIQADIKKRGFQSDTWEKV